ncbi:MAG: hypothetical protein ACX939_01770 [Hyphococcus sp.]
MADLSLQQKDVRELQRLAQEAPLKAKPPRNRSISRSARIELIDLLSRWSMTGLAFIAGLGIYLAIVAGRAYPLRAACWAAMLTAAIWACRRLQHQYRAGGAIAGRPFYWRASYTSCLSVMGVIFCSAPILLTPAGAPELLYLQVAAIAIIGGFAAAMAHSAHLATAAAMAAPAAVLSCLAALRSGDGAILAAAMALSAMGLAITFGLNRIIVADAARRNPRTAYARRERQTDEHVFGDLAAPTASATAQ